MKKIKLLSLLLILICFLCGCSKGNTTNNVDNNKIDNNLSIDEKLKLEYPDIYNNIELTICSIVYMLDYYLEEETEFIHFEDFPYISLYFVQDDNLIVNTDYLYNDEIALTVSVYFNPENGTINKVDTSTFYRELTEEAIIFAMIHIDEFTNSVDITETLALKESLSSNDEFTSHEVANKWKTSKYIISDDIVDYTIELAK